MEGGKSATCVGGWQWGVSAYSEQVEEARSSSSTCRAPRPRSTWRSTRRCCRSIPSVYTDPEVTEAAPWFADALAAVVTAKPRPVTPRYNEVSDVVRTTVNAVLAGSKTPEEGADQIEARLARVLR